MLAYIFLALISSSLSLETTISYQDKSLTFSRSLLGTGFKRDLVTTITVHDPTITHLNITEKVPKEWFVDQEEVPGNLNSFFPNMIDIEKPVSSSSDHIFYIWLDVSNPELSYFYPIHTRYNQPNLEQDTVRIELAGPSVVLSTGKKLEIPGRIQAEMPVGRLEDLKMVLWVTLCISGSVAVWLMISIVKGDDYRKKQV
jgi:hypothetical protein